MHIPKLFKETDLDTLIGLIEAKPLGTWITSSNDELDVNHIPFVIDRSQGEYGVLKGHVNKANPVWELLPTHKPSVICFQGVDTYITPSWYASKQEHGKVVPTWNYFVVHAHGVANAIHDKDWLLEHLNELTDQNEAKEALPWKIADAPSAYIDKMVNGIVGIEIQISDLLGTYKASQNKQQADKLGVLDGLNSRSTDEALQMAGYVSQHTK